MKTAAIRNLPYRYSLAIDATSAIPSKLAEVSYLEEIVRTCAKQARMAVLHLSTSDVGMDTRHLGREPKEDEAGYSVLALISTSHIALHTWPKQAYFMFDLSSCRPFNFTEISCLIHEKLFIEEIIYENTVEGDMQVTFQEGFDKHFKG